MQEMFSRTLVNIFWQSSDKRTKLLRSCHGVFVLEYDDNEVMFGTFERLNAYLWAEFICEPELLYGT